MPFVIGHFKRWQVDRYEKEHENDPSMLQNNIYTTAFCTNVAYPKGVEFAGYTAQGYVKPYELTIHVNGSAAKNEYNMAAAMAFNVARYMKCVWNHNTVKQTLITLLLFACNTGISMI